MKLFLPAFLIFVAATLTAQTTSKLPKITLIEGGLSLKYNIGDERKSKSEVKNHLRKNENATGEASALWKKADAQNGASTAWMVAMIAGGALLVTGILKENNPAIYGGGGIAAAGAIFSLSYGSNSNKNYRKSVAAYNKAAGY